MAAIHFHPRLGQEADQSRRVLPYILTHLAAELHRQFFRIPGATEQCQYLPADRIPPTAVDLSI